MGDGANDPFGLMLPATRVDPYGAYDRLRAQAPVHYSEAWACWVIARYDDAVACFRDPRLSANRSSGYAAKLPPAVREQLAPLIGNLGSWALLIDPPDHTRIRGLVAKAFTPRVIEALRPKIEGLCDELLDRAEAEARASGSVDLLAGLADPLPVAVIGDMLGLPREDGEKLERWSAALTDFLGAAGLSQEIVGRALGATIDLEAYFREVFIARRDAPGDDLLSELLIAHEQDDRLSEQELLSTCNMLLFGGHETTTNLIANAVLALLTHPEQLEALRADPAGRVAGAVEEVLRYEAPIQRMGRVAKAAIALRGQTIAAGDRVYMLMGAANRDPERFAAAERFDITRADANKHLTFGFGTHFCLGAALGRMEGQIALSKLVERFSGLGLAVEREQLRWLDNLTVRGLEALPVRLG